MAKEESSPGRPPWAIAANWPASRAADVERRFEQLIRERWGSPASHPPADVFVRGTEIWVEVDLPGVQQKQVRAYVEHGELVVEARREIEPPSGTETTARRERSPGRLERRGPLPRAIERPLLDVRLQRGVLRIRVRPAEEER